MSFCHWHKQWIYCCVPSYWKTFRARFFFFLNKDDAVTSTLKTYKLFQTNSVKLSTFASYTLLTISFRFHNYVLFKLHVPLNKWTFRYRLRRRRLRFVSLRTQINASVIIKLWCKMNQVCFNLSYRNKIQTSITLKWIIGLRYHWSVSCFILSRLPIKSLTHM